MAGVANKLTGGGRPTAMRLEVVQGRKRGIVCSQNNSLQLRRPNLDLPVMVVPPSETLPREFFHEPVMPEW